MVKTESKPTAFTNWRRQNPLYRWRIGRKPKVTMEAAAAACGVARLSWRNWETGTKPKLLSFDRIAALMGVERMTLVRRWNDWLRRRPGVSIQNGGG